MKINDEIDLRLRTRDLSVLALFSMIIVIAVFDVLSSWRDFGGLRPCPA